MVLDGLCGAKRATTGGALVVLLVCHAGPRAAFADIVHMKDGGKIEGLVKEQGKDVVIETLGGVVKLSAKGVASIDTEHVSTVEVYYEKLQSAKASDDPWASIELAAWAKGVGAGRFVRPNMERAAALAKKIADARSVLALVERAREKGLSTGLAPLHERVVALDPENETARRALGYRLREGRWLSEEEFHAAEGNVRFRGKWISRAERDVLAKELALRLDARERIVKNREAIVGRKEKELAAAAKKIATERQAAEKLKREASTERARLEKERKDLERERRNLEALRRRTRR
ncbi:MAG: hypothetical protein ACYS9X_21540 [Planctomycetota bacterium]|jgi:TPR repeat protein